MSELGRPASYMAVSTTNIHVCVCVCACCLQLCFKASSRAQVPMESLSDFKPVVPDLFHNFYLLARNVYFLSAERPNGAGWSNQHALRADERMFGKNGVCQS